ncbi:MAG: hypothetical protein WC382_03850 [Methanoregulaceae archaeon]
MPNTPTGTRATTRKYHFTFRQRFSAGEEDGCAPRSRPVAVSRRR